MLKDAGAGFVILGHSERRQLFGETSALVREKVRAALDIGLEVILCVGEHLDERECGFAEAAVCAQLRASLPEGNYASRNLTVAYEPVWSIGSGIVPQPDEIVTMNAAIRQTLREKNAQVEPLRLLYGGSVNAGNAKSILALPDVQGALVGNASLNPESFAAILGQVVA